MIKYTLICSRDHDFEGWFSSGEEFDRLVGSGHLTCPSCGDAQISKALMAPSVRPARNRAKATATPPQGPEAAPMAETPSDMPAMASLPPRLREEFVSKMREFRKQVTENAENVGERFSEEARKIHYGEARERGIYGSAKAEEARDLVEEGIAVLPLPVLPEDSN